MDALNRRQLFEHRFGDAQFDHFGVFVRGDVLPLEREQDAVLDQMSAALQ